MYTEGYVKFFRSILAWEWYDDLPTCRLFIHLLLTVNLNGDVWHGVDIPAGSRVASLETLSREATLTKKQIRGSLDKLERAGCVARSHHGKITVITVLNWDKYQTRGHGGGQQKGTELGTIGARSGHDEGPRIRNKEIKKEKKEENSGCAASPSGLPEGFGSEEEYIAYLRR